MSPIVTHSSAYTAQLSQVVYRRSCVRVRVDHAPHMPFCAPSNWFVRVGAVAVECGRLEDGS